MCSSDLVLLLTLLGEEKNSDSVSRDSTKSRNLPRYLRVVINPKPGAPPRPNYHGTPFTGTVNVRVPFGIIRAGMKLATLIPPEAADRVNDAIKEKGMHFDISRLKPEDLEELMSALQDTEINVDSGFETVRVYAE